MVDDFKDKLFLICGGSSGIGYAVAEELAIRQARLILLSRRQDKLESASESLKAKGCSDIQIAPFDLCDRSTPDRVCELVGDQKLRGVLINGGGPLGGPASQLTWDQFEQGATQLIAGPFSLLNALLDRIEAPGGSVVAITSTTVKEPNKSIPISSTYRSGVVALLKHYADEFAPDGIRFNNIAPGFTDTDRLNELAVSVSQNQFGDSSANSIAKVFKMWEEKATMNRLGEANEIAKACRFLFSSDSSFMTGQTLVVDGGQVRGY